jgi:transposase
MYANPLKTKAIGVAEMKNDKLDVKLLAQLRYAEMVAKSYVPLEEIRERRALARGRKKLAEKRTDCKNEVHALLDQQGITHTGSLWSDAEREFLAELTFDEPRQLLLDQWMEAVDEFDAKIKRTQQKIEKIATQVEETDLLMSAPGIAAYSGVMIRGEIGEVDRFDRAAKVVSYAGFDPVVRESPDSRTEGVISKHGNGYLRWILVQCASTAVHNVKDPYLSEFYWRLRKGRNKLHQVAIVATARKLFVSLFHMLKNEEMYDPPEVSASCVLD